MKLNFKLGSYYVTGSVLALLALIFDQLSKVLILKYMNGNEHVVITPFANLVLVWNKGISFGVFNSDAYNYAYGLVAMSFAIVIPLFIWLLQSNERLLSAALGLIIGGAVGNVLDRLRLGAVVDFIDVYWRQYHWPAFNIADSCIAIGAFIMLFITLKNNEAKK